MRRDFCKDLKALLAKITGPFYSIFPFITLHYLHHLLTSPFFQIDLQNYLPDPAKRSELKKRLYDSGISNVPMPSVKRPIED